MVQVLPASNRSAYAQNIGEAIGLGMGRNFPQPEQVVKRDMLQNAFKNLQTLAQNPNATPLELTTSFLEATAGIDGAERYVGQVLPMILQYARGQRGSELQNPSMQQTQQMPQQGQQAVSPIAKQAQAQQAPEQVQTSNALNKFLRENPTLPPPDVNNSDLFTGTLEPTALGKGPIPNTYSPETIQRLQQEDLQAGFPDSPRAERALQYNELARKDIEDVRNAALAQSQISQAARESDLAFRDYLKNFVGNDDTMLALAENISKQPEYRNIANDQIRAEKVNREVQLLGKQVNAFKNASVRPNPYIPYFRQLYDKNFDSLNASAQPLIKMGLRPQLQKMLTDNKWTTTEVEQILNPLGDDKIRSIKSFPLYSSPFFDDSGYNKTVNEKWKQALPRLIKSGEKNVKNLETMVPGTSLLLLRNEFMKKNGDWRDFEKLVRGLVTEGKLNLDPYQQSELNQISEPPVKTLTFDEFMFGTRSK